MSRTEVLYNESCPVCRREVHHYRRLSEADGLPIAYADLDDPDGRADWGLSRDAAAARLHVRKDGEVLSGVPAFVALWREIPRYRWLARLVSLPGVHGLACLVYDHILAPALVAFDKRRHRRG